MFPRPRVLIALAVASLLAALAPSAVRAGTRIDNIPAVGGFGTSLLYHTITPIDSRVINVSFIATYDNRGTGFDAAYTRFELVNFDTYETWTLTGSQLGWSGEGVFQAVRSSSAFSGPLEGTVLWETVTLAPGDLDADFRVVIDLGGFEGPDRPFIP